MEVGPKDLVSLKLTCCALPIVEFSAKERYGPPAEGPLDVGLEVWSGVVPVSLLLGEPIPA